MHVLYVMSCLLAASPPLASTFAIRANAPPTTRDASPLSKPLHACANILAVSAASRGLAQLACAVLLRDELDSPSSTSSSSSSSASSSSFADLSSLILDDDDESGAGWMEGQDMNEDVSEEERVGQEERMSRGAYKRGGASENAMTSNIGNVVRALSLRRNEARREAEEESVRRRRGGVGDEVDDKNVRRGNQNGGRSASLTSRGKRRHALSIDHSLASLAGLLGGASSGGRQAAFRQQLLDLGR